MVTGRRLHAFRGGGSRNMPFISAADHRGRVSCGGRICYHYMER